MEPERKDGRTDGNASKEQAFCLAMPDIMPAIIALSASLFDPFIHSLAISFVRSFFHIFAHSDSVLPLEENGASWRGGDRQSVKSIGADASSTRLACAK